MQLSPPLENARGTGWRSLKKSGQKFGGYHYFHHRGNTLYLIRTAKLSPLRHAQYSGGGPRGNRMCCRLFCFAFFFAACPISKYHGVLSSWLKGNSGRCHPWCSVGSSEIQIRTSISHKAHNCFFKKLRNPLRACHVGAMRQFFTIQLDSTLEY